MKVNKEEMLGMLVALELYLKKDHERERREFDQRAEMIRKAAAAVAGVTAEIFVPEVANHVPHVRVSWNAAEKGLTVDQVIKAMLDGDPSIGLRQDDKGLFVGVWMMRPGEEKVVAKRLREVLETKG
jgi:D-glucosaminate-6-phosphate ammonia-lyase